MKRDRFKKMTTMIKNGQPQSIEDFCKEAFGGGTCEVYRNSKYQVIKKQIDTRVEESEMVWLSIKRIDREIIHDWRELQNIKNEIVGRYCEGIEIYPAESRLVDTANQYHLWVFVNPQYRIPFGMNTRIVTDKGMLDGAKQRTLRLPLWAKLLGQWKIKRLLKQKEKLEREDLIGKANKLIDNLQELYDDNQLTEKDEATVLDSIKFLGGSINW